MVDLGWTKYTFPLVYGGQQIYRTYQAVKAYYNPETREIQAEPVTAPPGTEYIYQFQNPNQPAAPASNSSPISWSSAGVLAAGALLIYALKK